MSDKSKGPSLGNELFLLFLKILMILFFFWIVFTFLYGGFRNDDAGMNPSIHQGDLVIYYRLDKNYYAQDVVAIKEDGRNQTRRVIAKEGDTIDIQEDGLYINGLLQVEPNIYTDTLLYEKGIEFPITLKKNELFVLGDDREKAKDSRIYGPISTKDTLGKVLIVIRSRDF